jgi:uncharacterized YigZ family protein
VAATVRVEIDKLKGSRFICDLAPAGDAAAALGFVDGVRVREPHASHHCWAFSLESGVTRSSDDGEPGGTAGKPILRRWVSAALTDVVAVVTRYYGGTNLGTGGLIRAYGSAAGAAIDAAAVVTRRRMVGFRIEHPYELTAAVAGVLAASDTVTVSSTYGASVVLEVRVPASQASGFADAVRNETAGAVTPAEIDP